MERFDECGWLTVRVRVKVKIKVSIVKAMGYNEVLSILPLVR